MASLRRWYSSVPLAFALALALGSCGGRPADVVLYCAVDQAHSEPIVRAFEAATGLKVDFQPDIEATKSIGHRRRIQEESNNPRCDVFWNNEVVQSVLLAEASPALIEPYISPAAADIPAQFKDPSGWWTGFASRARVLIVNTERFPSADDYPKTTDAFLVPGEGELCSMAKPLTGTTAAHGAVWLNTWGQEQTFAHLSAMRENGVRFGPGNAHLMRLVRDGKLDFGWTDTDDVKSAIDQGYPVARVVPDQGPGEFGLIVIPNTVSLIKNAPHPEAARKLIDFLLSHEVEAMLAAGDSGQIPVRAAVPRPDGVLKLDGLKLAAIDWAAVGHTYAKNVDALEDWFNK
ncbi:MAG: iron(III) transport system substrate-binding protein [Pseudohongiellaceae bacterium]|jgi:iron(III) transport system substrate-binding protein